MSTLLGLLSGTALLLCAFNLLPGFHLAWPWQIAAVAALIGTNLVFWKRTQPPPMPLQEAATDFAKFFALIGALAVVDTFIGFASGAQTVPQAFIHSGAFGGILDIFLLAVGLLVGVPTLVRSVWQYHRDAVDMRWP